MTNAVRNTPMITESASRVRTQAFSNCNLVCGWWDRSLECAIFLPMVILYSIRSTGSVERERQVSAVTSLHYLRTCRSPADLTADCGRFNSSKIIDMIASFTRMSMLSPGRNQWEAGVSDAGFQQEVHGGRYFANGVRTLFICPSD